MCSIMCYVGTLTEKESEAFLPKFTEGFEKTKSRGPDMSEVLQFGSGVCAFHRLAIIDLMKPVCNRSVWMEAIPSATENCMDFAK